jgi:hypothetical protein
MEQSLITHAGGFAALAGASHCLCAFAEAWLDIGRIGLIYDALAAIYPAT